MREGGKGGEGGRGLRIVGEEHGEGRGEEGGEGGEERAVGRVEEGEAEAGEGGGAGGVVGGVRGLAGGGGEEGGEVLLQLVVRVGGVRVLHCDSPPVAFRSPPGRQEETKQPKPGLAAGETSRFAVFSFQSSDKLFELATVRLILCPCVAKLNYSLAKITTYLILCTLWSSMIIT
jgi:hypothetical protein